MRSIRNRSLEARLDRLEQRKPKHTEFEKLNMLSHVQKKARLLELLERIPPTGVSEEVDQRARLHTLTRELVASGTLPRDAVPEAWL